MEERQPRPDRPLPLKWEFASGIPTYDFVSDYRLDKPWGVENAVEMFLYKMENDNFLDWESVVAEEQGLPLTEKQDAALGGLLNFGDPGNDRVLYINEIPRPNAPWYVILNKIVPHILVEPFRTADVHYSVHSEGWRNLVDCLAEHAGDLTLPPGASSPLEVVPPELRHKLRLQDSFNALSGLGQSEDLTLVNEEPQDRVDEFIGLLAEHKDSVQFFHLTLDSLLQERLRIRSTSEPIAPYLSEEVQRLLSKKEELDREKRRLLAEKDKREREVKEARAKERPSRRQLPFAQQEPERIGRNGPCPCGSGKKSKRCCMKRQDGGYSFD